jgi:hypothetical protein
MGLSSLGRDRLEGSGRGLRAGAPPPAGGLRVPGGGPRRMVVQARAGREGMDDSMRRAVRADRPWAKRSGPRRRPGEGSMKARRDRPGITAFRLPQHRFASAGMPADRRT